MLSEDTLDPALRLPQHISQTLVDPTAYASDRLHEAYAWLRANQPLGVATPEGFDPFWVVTRHADILHVSKNNAVFANGRMQTTLINRAGDARMRAITGGSPHMVYTLVQMDGSEHMQHRLLTQAWFMPKNLKSQAIAIDEISARHVNGMAERGGSCDFVKDVALYYPLEVIMRILGIPDADRPRMLRLTQELFGANDADSSRMMQTLPLEQIVAMLEFVIKDFTDYFDALSADRRANPQDDLSTVIANAKIDGKQISSEAAAGYYILIATAGHDTTSSSTAGAMQNLATHPQLLATLKADPSQIPAFIEEAIRWTTPVKTFMRSATQDTQIAGQDIAKDDWMMLCYASGNRDEAVFDHPNQFQIREPNAQLSFGYGVHVCLGQYLARMEMIAFFEKLIPRLKSVKLNGDPTMSEALFVNGLKTLPITYEME